MASPARLTPLVVAMVLVLAARSAQAQTNGTSLTADATVMLSSNSMNSTRAAIVDRNDTTAWQSGANFPTGYIGRADMNLLLNLCTVNAAACTASAGSKSLAGATDNSVTTTAASLAVPAPGAPAWMRVALPGAAAAPDGLRLRRVSVRTISAAAASPVLVQLETAAGSLVTIGNLTAGYTYYHFKAPAVTGGSYPDGTVAVVLMSAASFSISELSATAVPSFEQAAVDLGAPTDIGTIRVRHWAGGDGLNTTLIYSLDGVTWVPIKVLDPQLLSAVTLNVTPAVTARYVAVRHLVKENDWAKVYCWGIDAWPPPPPPPPSTSPSTSPSPDPSPSTSPDPGDPLAGTNMSFTYGKPVSVSTHNMDTDHIVDQLDNTQWQSDACYPTDYMSRADMNPLKDGCATPGRCTASAGATDTSKATDQNVYTGTGVPLPPGTPAGAPGAWVQATLPAPATVLRASVKGFGSSPLDVMLVMADGTSVKAASLDCPSQNYQWASSQGSWPGVVAVRVQSMAGFTLTEFGVQTGPCTQWATVDMLEVKQVGVIRVRFWSPDSNQTTLSVSADNVTWTQLQTFDPNVLDPVNVTVDGGMPVRYITVKHTLTTPGDWKKASIWSIDAWPPLPPSPSPSTSPSPETSPSPSPGPGEWNPLAGTIRSFTYGKPVSVSTHNMDTAHIVDQLDNTQWQSDACYPTDYMSRADMNPLKDGCATPGRCTASAGATDTSKATDQNVYTGTGVPLPPGTPAGAPGAWVQATLPAPATVLRASVKGFGSSPLDVMLVMADGTSVKAASLDCPSQNYQWTSGQGSWPGVVAVRVQSTAGFTLTEFGVQTGPCIQWATVDMQEVKQVGMVRVRFWSPDSNQTTLSVSADNVTWTQLQVFDPNVLSPVDVWLDDLTPIRYITLNHTITNLGEWKKIYVWTIDAFDQFGQWGPPPAPARSPRTLRQLFGLNGIWGWGFKMFSGTAIKEGKGGPLLYNEVASSGRNYHNVEWDVRWPDRDPHYNTMKTQGTDGQWWLDWDLEYRAWRGAGLPVVASFQFTRESFYWQAAAAWGPDPYTTAYKLGNKFAAHFGPANNGTVEAVEFGNEPWSGYNASWYRDAFRGWVDGARAADPNMKILPCALQAAVPSGEDNNGGNFVGARVEKSVAPYLYGLNHHTYSYYTISNGSMTSVHPEHPGTSFNGVNNFMAWRDTNMPGKPVWVTEWGWDAALPGEACNGTHCVSQYAQAVYAIRGLLILARKGVEQTHWFFYANFDGCSTLYCRSGLRGANETGFPILPVYRSVRGLMQLAGASSFLDVISESKACFAYVLGNSDTGNATHVIAWRPIMVGEGPTDEATVTIPVASKAALVGGVPQKAYVIDGVGDSGYHDAPLPTASAGGWQVQVSGAPLLIKLQA